VIEHNHPMSSSAIPEAAGQNLLTRGAWPPSQMPAQRQR
jgi:hypothetical protein